MIKQAIIPLAGLGTRLLPLTSVIPKELLPINGKPALEYILDECIECGIKEVILSNKSKFYHEKYKNQGKLYAKTRGNNHAISLAPRYLVELVTYGTLVSLILGYQVFYPNELQSFISLITVYAIASLKLLPALQHIFTSITLFTSEDFPISPIIFLDPAKQKLGSKTIKSIIFFIY